MVTVSRTTRRLDRDQVCYGFTSRNRSGTAHARRVWRVMTMIPRGATKVPEYG
jgi:hypothetical protein